MATEQAKKQNDKPKTQMGCGDIVSDFIEDVWQVMTPEMVDHLKCILTEDMGMTNKEVKKFIANQREIRRERICLKKDNRVVRIGPRNQWIKELSKDIGDQMALFIVGILLSNRNARTKRITEKILDHLCEITGENTTVDTAKTRVERTMVVVADRMAAWIDEAITDIESNMKDRFPPVSSFEDLPTSTAESSETETTSTTETSVCDTSLMSRESLAPRRKTISDKSMVSDEGEEDLEREEDETEQEENIFEELTDEEKNIEELTDDEKNIEELTDEEKSEESAGERETEEEKSEEEVDEGLESEEEGDTEEVESEQEEGEEEEEQEAEEQDEEEEEDEGIVTPTERSEKESKAEDEKREASLETVQSADRQASVEVTDGDQGKLSNVVSEEKKALVDLLELLKEDFTRIPKEREKTKRQKAMKKVIDKRFEEIIRGKLDESLDSLVKYDIEDAASTVSNWIERVLASADLCSVTSSVVQPELGPKLGSAFEVMRGDGSQYKVSKLSSTTVAQKVAVARGLEPPRKKKLPRTMSPMNLKSTRDWADWALGAAKVGEEWGDWLDRTLTEVERQLLRDRGSATRVERYEEWSDWRSKRGVEAIKWRVEKQRIKNEAVLWSKKLQKEFHEPEKQTRTFSY